MNGNRRLQESWETDAPASSRDHPGRGLQSLWALEYFVQITTTAMDVDVRASLRCISCPRYLDP
jgi:hypothetical protein